MREYDAIAEWYASDRRAPTGVPEVTAFASSLQPGSRVLDIGCGNGRPLTDVLVSAGHRVVGLDSSREMLMRFHGNLPETPIVRGVIQDCAFQDEVFDGAIAWGVIFHLRRADQTRALASVSRILRADAPFLFTSGDVSGDDSGITGTMNGVTFRYYSFSADEYRIALDDHGLTLQGVHKDEGQSTYYLARKARMETLADSSRL